MPDVAAVIVAAGRGTRAAGGDLPKQFRRIGGETMLRRDAVHVRRTSRTSAAYSRSSTPRMSRSIATRRPVSRLWRRSSAAPRGRPRCAPASKRSARTPPDIVLIHDAARPFASADAGVARDRGRRSDRRGDPGAAGDRHGQDRRCRRPRRQDARPQYVAAGADAAGLRLRRAARRASPRRRAKAATISPTTPRSPNGPA